MENQKNRPLMMLEYYLNPPKFYTVKEIWVYARTKDLAKCFWQSIASHVDVDKNIKIRFGIPRHNEGLNSKNVIILLCHEWYKPRRATSFVVTELIRNCIASIPIDDCPEMKLDDSTERE